MDTNLPIIFGPAYLDLVVETDRPLAEALLDQSAPASTFAPDAAGDLRILGPSGDRMLFHLPPDARDLAGVYALCEPVLARLYGADTRRVVHAAYPVTRVARQLGGMGAGYAMALHGLLRMPLGGTVGHADGVGAEVLAMLAALDIPVEPHYLPAVASDASLIVLSPRGDKLAVGVRQAMLHWQADAADRALLARADALVFCGVPNALTADLLAHAPPVPVLCAPAMRNIRDAACPLAAVAPRIHYLTLNALEWEHLPEKDAVRAAVPVITVTDGPRGSRVFLHDEEISIPAAPHVGPMDVNRAGETYAATFFKVLRAAAPDFPAAGVSPALAARAGRIAAAQAERQLSLTAFAFPPDDWQVDED